MKSVEANFVSKCFIFYLVKYTKLFFKKLKYKKNRNKFEKLIRNFNLPIEAALLQRIEGKDLPIAFYSRSMTSAEKNYDTSQKELLAVIKSVEHFKQFLYGKEFVIKTDHHPLTSITTKSKPSVRLGRWLSELADYQFRIEHKKGAENILADALSRLNLPNDVYLIKK